MAGRAERGVSSVIFLPLAIRSVRLELKIMERPEPLKIEVPPEPSELLFSIR